MKIFSPTAIAAIGLALTTSSFEQVQAVGCTFPTGVTGANVDVPQATGGTPGLTTAQKRVAANACPTGQISYLKSVVVLPQGNQAMTNVEVQLFKGDATTPITGLTAETCDGIKYTNVGMSAASTADISYKVVCKDTAAVCTVTHGAEWGCYTPFFAKSLDKTVKRKTQVGTGCTSDTDACVSRCARSYKITTDSTGATATMKTAYTPGDCTCTDLTATVQDDGISAKKDTSLTVSVDGTTITVKTATCTSTYEEGAVTNPFTAGTYTRGTVTPDTCVTTDCTYKCGAELALTAPSNDAVVGTPATVSGCTCTAISTIVSDDDTKATGKSGTTTYELSKTATTLTVKSTVGSATCTAPYTVKGASGGSTNTTSPTPSPTSGVSVNTIWAVAATAVIAVAGAFVMV